MTQTVLGIAGIIGAITAILTFCYKIYKFVRSLDTRFNKIDDIEKNMKTLETKFDDRINYIDERSQLQDEALKAMLRNNITNTYYKHAEDKTLREYEFEEMVQASETYFKLGGNSYIRELHDKMCGWDVIS